MDNEQNQKAVAFLHEQAAFNLTNGLGLPNCWFQTMEIEHACEYLRAANAVKGLA